MLVMINLGTHEGPAKDWRTILVATVVVAFGVTGLVLHFRESRQGPRPNPGS